MNPSNASTPASVSRRVIREATIQLLHATSGDSEQGDPWPLILAPVSAKITRARARVVLHLQQNRPARVKPITALLKTAPALLENFLEDKSSSKNLRLLYKSEKTLTELFDLTRRQLKSEKEPETIAKTLEDIQSVNATSLQALKELSKAVGSPDSCPQALAPLAKALPPLQETSELLRALFSQELPELPETKALREVLAEREALQAEASKLRQLVLDHQEETDQLLTKTLENFSFDRLAQVDRAVLRLATTELNHCPDIPAAVSINEAIEVARRFGGTESAGFVNGVLDKLKGQPSSEKKPK